eukprot:gene12139-biopygen7873
MERTVVTAFINRSKEQGPCCTTAGSLDGDGWKLRKRGIARYL